MKKTENYYLLPVSLQQFIIHTNRPTTSNSICAIYTKNIKTIVIRPEYRDGQDEILFILSSGLLINTANINIIYGDGFHIDTWDNMIDKIQTKIQKP